MNLNKIKTLNISTPQGNSGVLSKEARYSFLAQGDGPNAEAALGLPIRAATYNHGALFSVFEMSRPEGYLLDMLRNRFGKQFNLDDMSLLKLTGKNQIGRIIYTDPLDDFDVPKKKITLDELLKSKASEELFNYLVDQYFDSGISGFQPKVMVNHEGGPIEKAKAITPNLIVKSAGQDFPHLAENEFLCMEVARIAGLNVPEFWLSEDNGLFIIRRFDIQEDGKKYGLEDMCSLMSISTEDKYNGSYEQVAKVIQAYCGDIRHKAMYFEYLALSVLLRNGDAHLKNFSLLYDHPHSDISLSPLYDVVTTSVYEAISPRTGMNVRDRTMALNLNKSKEYPSIKELLDFGKKHCDVSKPQDVIDRIESAKSKVASENRDRINSDFLEKILVEWGVVS